MLIEAKLRKCKVYTYMHKIYSWVRFYIEITVYFLRLGHFRAHFCEIPLLYFRNYEMGGLPSMRSAISRKFK